MFIIITGTSRGIGLELTRRALTEGHHVLAVARNPDQSAELMNLKDQFTHLEILELDILQQNSHLKIREQIKNWPHLDIIINNAGILTEDDSIEDFSRSFLTNSTMPFFITRALLEKLKLSQRPVSLQITSMMGSITDNTSGGNHSYRASKTALNMLFKGLSLDEKWLTSLLVHPGWVQTHMGGTNAPLTIQESVAGIWKIRCEASLEQSGTFIDYRGRSLPW